MPQKSYVIFFSARTNKLIFLLGCTSVCFRASSTRLFAERFVHFPIIVLAFFRAIERAPTRCATCRRCFVAYSTGRQEQQAARSTLCLQKRTSAIQFVAKLHNSIDDATAVDGLD